MTDWLNTVLISIATTVVTGILALPRLEARNRRIQAAHQIRDGFSDAVLTILVCGARWGNLSVPDGATPGVRSALEGERERWLAAVDMATRDLVDSTAPLTFALVARTAAAKYAAHTRMVWLSERSNSDKITLLIELAGDAHTAFFTAWWRFPSNWPSLVRLARLGEESPTSN